jgi:hypothetical protein
MPLALALGLMGAGKAVEGISNAIAADRAAKAQQKGAKEARGQIEGYYNKAVGYQQPYYDVGTQNLQTVNQRNAAGYYDMPTQTYQQPQFNFQADPGYQFRMNEGMRGINNNMSAQGMSLSGATMKALQKYGQGMASQEYGNAYNRFSNDRQFDYGVWGDAYNRQAQEKAQQWNRGIGLANVGVNAANQMGNYAMNAGQSVADTVIGGANAKAAGIMGVGQSIGNMGQNISSMGQIPLAYSQPYGQQQPYGQGNMLPYNYGYQPNNNIG